MKDGREQKWGDVWMILLLLTFLLIVIVETAVSMYINKGREKEESNFGKWKKKYKQKKAIVIEKEES